MAEIKNNTGKDIGRGQIQIADDVIAVIAGTASMEVEGVTGMNGSLGDFVGILGLKNLSKGVKVEVKDGRVKIDVNIIVKFGYKLQEVSASVQKRVKTAVETMTGFVVDEVNVLVTNVSQEKEQKDRDKEKDKGEPTHRIADNE